MFTLNGGHIWPLYEAARNQGVRVVDTRHEQSATFAAEAYAKLTRRPGVAALTAGPGHHQRRVGGDVGVVQRLAARRARRAGAAAALGRRVAAGARPRADPRVDHEVGGDRHRSGQGRRDGPRGDRAGRRSRTAARCSSTSRSTCSARRPATSRPSTPAPAAASSPIPTPSPALADAGRRRRAAGVRRRQRRLLGRRRGTSWRPPSSTCGCRCSPTGSAAGTLPADHELAFLRTRGVLKQRADVVVVLGTPLDFRLGFGRFGDGRRSPTSSTPTSQRAAHVDVPTVAGDIAATLRGAGRARRRPAPTTSRGSPSCAPPRRRRGPPRRRCWRPATAPIKPTRVYGELRKRLARDAVVICDGGDFASYAGKYVEVFEPGCWLDTGPYGCLGNGMGYSIAARVARPDAADRRRCSATAPPGSA